MELLLRHWGVDWVAIALTFTSLYRLGNRKRDGFAFGMAANLAWAVFGVLVLSLATVGANAVFLALNIRGWVRWAPAEPT
jgi:hypothetical protein